MILTRKNYTVKEIQEVKKEILNNNNRDWEFILGNIQAIRLFGWTILTGTEVSTRKLNGYGDVVKYNPMLKADTLVLYIPRANKEHNERRTNN